MKVKLKTSKTIDDVMHDKKGELSFITSERKKCQKAIYHLYAEIETISKYEELPKETKEIIKDCKVSLSLGDLGFVADAIKEDYRVGVLYKKRTPCSKSYCTYEDKIKGSGELLFDKETTDKAKYLFDEIQSIDGTFAYDKEDELFLAELCLTYKEAQQKKDKILKSGSKAMEFLKSIEEKLEEIEYRLQKGWYSGQKAIELTQE